MRVGGCEGVRTGIMRMDRLVLMNIDLGKNIKEQRAITTCLKSILHYAFLALVLDFPLRTVQVTFFSDMMMELLKVTKWDPKCIIV